MSPKIPVKPKSPPIRRSEPQLPGLAETATPSGSRISPPAGLRPRHLESPPLSLGQPPASQSQAPANTPAGQNVQVTSIAEQAGGLGPGTLENYRVSTPESLPPPNQQGLRITKKRRYVDLEDGGTVMVVYDAQLDTYRAKRIDELLPSGPALYRIGQSSVWGERTVTSAGDQPPAATQPPVKRPRLADEPTVEARPAQVSTAPGLIIPKFSFSTQSLYIPFRGPDNQGYYQLMKRGDLRPDGSITFPAGLISESPDLPFTLFAFSKNDKWVQVTPPEGRIDSSGQSIPPERLPSWTDRDIWEHYGLQGNDITRFRSEASVISRKPQWAETTQEGNPREQLIRELKWVYPEKTPEERGQLLRSYNLLPSMLPRLKQAVQETGKIPQWAEAHKRQSMDESNPRRFDLLENEVMPHIRNLRNFKPHSLDQDFDAYYTPLFYEAFLLKLGYRKNIHGCLYRTDIPALFRSEDRTPFELARDGCMLARENHPRGSTTKKALSATFSLRDAKGYGVGGGPGIGQLRYNTQLNKYPGKRPAAYNASSDSDSDASSQGASSNASQSAVSRTSGAAGRKDSESDSASFSDSSTAVSLDSERGYDTARHRQVTSFIYMIDTRNVEVVPGAENYFFNYEAENVHFPYDDIEGHISVSRRGISADRIWLVNSSLTRAAKVQAIQDAAGASETRIENATWDGVDNGHVYDDLIDQVAESDEVVLNWPADSKIFSDDVIWPDSTD